MKKLAWLFIGVGVVVTVIARVKDQRPSFVCALRGHTDVLVFGGTKIHLRCADCGQETRGWNLAHQVEEQV
jgi:hypothetical protein